MGILTDYADHVRRSRSPGAAPDREIVLPPLPDGAATLDEYESKQLIAAAGIPVTRDVPLPLSLSPAALAGIGFPVAVKILSRDIAHKTELGAVSATFRK